MCPSDAMKPTSGAALSSRQRGAPFVAPVRFKVTILDYVIRTDRQESFLVSETSPRARGFGCQIYLSAVAGRASMRARGYAGGLSMPRPASPNNKPFPKSLIENQSLSHEFYNRL